MSEEPTTVLDFPQRLPDLRERLKLGLWELIGDFAEEELREALAAGRHERAEGRRGHRNGHVERELLSEYGPCQVRLPRAQVWDEKGAKSEWHSRIVGRYQRRTKRVDEAILGCYLGGANTRRIRKALSPLWGDGLLSKSAISRLVGKLKERFDAWRARDLSRESCKYLFLDGLRVAVRLARRVVKVPVLVALGVRENGRKVLLAISIAGSESLGSWGKLVEDLKKRNLSDPILTICDGNQGLVGSVRTLWPQADVQRCLKHKLDNLLDHAPKHCHAELKRDFHEVHFGESPEAVKTAYEGFRAKWAKLCPAVVRSLDEAGEDLLTFTQYPQSQWSVLRTTNHIERLNGEFRRRVKTQGSFPTEDAALVLLWGLVAFGQIELRRIRGYQDLPKVIAAKDSLKKAA